MAFRYRLNKATGEIDQIDVFKESITTVEFYGPTGGKRLENKDTKAHRWFPSVEEAKTYGDTHFDALIKEAKAEVDRLVGAKVKVHNFIVEK